MICSADAKIGQAQDYIQVDDGQLDAWLSKIRRRRSMVIGGTVRLISSEP